MRTLTESDRERVRLLTLREGDGQQGTMYMQMFVRLAQATPIIRPHRDGDPPIGGSGFEG